MSRQASNPVELKRVIRLTEQIAVTIRKAREADRAALEHIAARTWEGTDYLPTVFGDWLADEHGEFFVAALADSGRIVGAGKLTRLAEGEWWLEGLRVDPDYYGQGVGRSLHNYAVQRAAEIGSGVVRFCTEATNTPVRRLAEATGFTLACSYLRYQAAPHRAFAGAFRRLTGDDVPAILAFLEKSAHFRYAERSAIGRRWICTFITAERLQEWAAEGRLFGWGGRLRDFGTLHGLVIAYTTLPRSGRPIPELTISYLDAPPGGFALLAQQSRGLAAEMNCGSLRYMLPVQPERLVAIEQAGWRRPENNSGKALLYSRSLRA